MDEGPSFYEPLKAGGRRERRAAVLVGVLLVAAVGVAILKPWGSPDDAAPPSPPTRAVASPATPSSAAPTTPASTPASPSGAPAIVPMVTPRVAVRPLPVAFTSPSSSPISTWTGLRWRRLAADDPLSIVTSVQSWRHGFIAMGSQSGPPATPVWTSGDGTEWIPLPVGTGSTFWPGMLVLGVAAHGFDLIAVGETAQYCATACTPTFELPVVSWTSQDGLHWAPHLLPQAWLASPEGRAPLLADGPAGLLVASRGLSARLATSRDGVAWRLLPASGFPARFALDDLRGTTAGYVAVGRWPTADGREVAAAMASDDGSHWPASPTILPAKWEAGQGVGPVVMSLAVGRGGMVAIGGGVTRPGGITWWRSPDGRHWTPSPDFSPLGATPCIDVGCGLRPDGALVADGRDMVALRGGADPGAWTSTDGVTWRRLTMTGDIPTVDAARAALVPGGVLLSHGRITWYGEAGSDGP